MNKNFDVFGGLAAWHVFPLRLRHGFRLAVDHSLLLSTAVLTVLVMPMRADSLLDPDAVPASTSDFTVNVSPLQTIQLPDPSHARSLAQRAVSQLQQTNQKLRQNAADIRGMSERIKSFDDRITDLQNQKAAALLDMRLGAFCRACHRTRSEVEAAGENWQDHLNRNSNGVAVPASQKDLDDKAKEFDDQINVLEAEKARTVPSLNAMIFQKQQESEALASKIDPQINLWRVAVALECSARNARERREDQADENALDVAENALDKIKGELDRPGLWTPEGRATAQQQESFWIDYIAQKQKQFSDRKAAGQRDADNASKAAEQDYRQIVQSLRSVDTKPFLSPVITSTLEHIPLSYGPVSIKFHADQTGSHPVGIDGMEVRVKAPGLPVSASLNVDTSDPIAIEIKDCFEALDRAEICIGNRTVYGPDGVRTEQIGTLTVKTPKPKVEVKILDEKPDEILLP